MTVPKLDDILKRLGPLLNEHLEKAVRRSWVLQDRHERLARRRAVIAMSAELERIEAIDIFSTGLGASAIEAIIMGEWSVAEDYVRWLSFKDEGEDCRKRYEPIWEKFVALLETACAEHRRNAGHAHSGKPS